jgi:hypothetical protein
MIFHQCKEIDRNAAVWVVAFKLPPEKGDGLWHSQVWFLINEEA